jgi:hypothetical protein
MMITSCLCLSDQQSLQPIGGQNGEMVDRCTPGAPAAKSSGSCGTR